MVGNNEATVLAVVGVLATCVGGLLWIIKFMFNKLLPMIESGISESKATRKESIASRNLIRDRNGRDSEIHKELMNEIRALPDRVNQNIREQHVTAQVVEQAIIKDKNS